MLIRFKNQVVARLSGLFAHCHHYKYGERTVLLYCLALSVAYVASLYVLVPPKIRRLDRDDPLHIQWRTLASMTISVGAIFSYPLFFCDLEGPDTFAITEVVFSSSHIKGVLLHTIMLYAGPITAGLLRVHEIRKRQISQGRKLPGSYPHEVFGQLLKPSLVSFLSPLTAEERWKNIRNFVVAPMTEEIVFRGCMVPALLASGMSPLKASIVAPLFFGVAHVHHAVTKLLSGEKMAPVLLTTVFQFAYTTMFGCYASYAFVRTGSVAAVTVSHAYCNWMGLPDMSFMQLWHPMYQYRIVLLIAFVIGTLAFKWMFRVDTLLPIPGVLVQAILGSSD
jgi:prenyl protein peptidase